MHSRCRRPQRFLARRTTRQPLCTARRRYLQSLQRYLLEQGYEEIRSRQSDGQFHGFGSPDWVPEENRATVAANLLADIKNHNYALTAGDIGFTYLVQALEQIGASDVIVKMNSRYDVPVTAGSWRSATACTESWQAYGLSQQYMMLGHLLWNGFMPDWADCA